MLIGGGNSQALQLVQCSYPTQGADLVVSAPVDKQLLVHSFSVTNADSSAQDLGLGVAFKYGVGARLFTKQAANTLISDISGGISLFTTTNDHGFYVQARKKFGYLSFNVTQAQSGTPVYALAYWNGSSWVSLPTTNLPDLTGTGNKCYTFNPPLDWETGNDAGLDDLSAANEGYCIRVIASTAPGQAVTANAVKIGYWIVFRQDIAAKQQLSCEFFTRGFLLEGGEGLLPYCGSAVATNTAEAAYQVNG